MHFVKTIILFMILFTNFILSQNLNVDFSTIRKISKIDNTSKYSFNITPTDNVIKKSHSLSNLIGQAAAGFGTGIILGGLPILVLTGSGTAKGLGSAISALVIGAPLYILGTSAGVYWVAKRENPEVRYLSSFGFSLMGMIGTIVYLSNPVNKNNIYTIEYIVALLLPVAGSILYTTCIADWPSKNNYSFQKGDSTLYDIVNNSKIFEFEFIRIKL